MQLNRREVLPVRKRVSQIAPKLPVQLLALDVDGTLLRSDARLSRRVYASIGKVIEQGVQVALVSARPPRSMQKLNERLELKELQASYNGALIYDPITSEVLYHKTLDKAVVRQAIDIARGMNPKLAISLEIYDQWCTDFVDTNLPVASYNNAHPNRLAPLETFLNDPVTKMLLLGQPEALKPIRAEINKALMGQFAFMVSDSHLLQLVHPRVNKGNALMRIAKLSRIPSQAVMAIGDAPNDLPMLQRAGFSVAMGNAWSSVKQVADVTVPSNDEDGVAFAIDRWILRR